MSLVLLEQCQVQFANYFQLNIEHLKVIHLQHTVIVGANGSGKSALTAYIAGQGEHSQGQKIVTEQLAWVSVTQQQALIEAEKQKDCADILDIIAEPTRVEEILFEGVNKSQLDQVLLIEVLEVFSLHQLLSRPFIALSTGETRKLLLAKAIINQPKLLILDEPWDGLDQATYQRATEFFKRLSTSMTLLFVVNRLSEIPAYCQQLLLINQGRIQWQAAVKDDLASQVIHLSQLRHIQQPTLSIPPADSDSFAPKPLDKQAPLVQLKQAQVKYGESKVFSGLDWTVLPGQHWQVTGPNGSGKTCLLNLITGDHPQCYVNDINVFGFQRGSGESIWQLKQYLGYMSNTLHLAYRVNCSALQVVLSGFYDSIGLYQHASKRQQLLAKQWLLLIALDSHENTPFQQLSFGDQRMLLIARAMVKHPSLLILDEPCNGLDELNRLKVLALIERLAQQGSTTLLYVNHHQEDVIPSIEHHLSMADYQG